MRAAKATHSNAVPTIFRHVAFICVFIAFIVLFVLWCVMPPRPYGLAKGLRGYLIRMKRGLRRMSGAYPQSWMTCVKQNHQQHRKGTGYP